MKISIFQMMITLHVLKTILKKLRMDIITGMIPKTKKLKQF